MGDKDIEKRVWLVKHEWRSHQQSLTLRETNTILKKINLKIWYHLKKTLRLY